MIIILIIIRLNADGAAKEEVDAAENEQVEAEGMLKHILGIHMACGAALAVVKEERGDIADRYTAMKMKLTQCVALLFSSKAQLNKQQEEMQEQQNQITRYFAINAREVA